MRTMIISAFPGCGKTYLSKHGVSENLKVGNAVYTGKNFSFSDSDSSMFPKTEDRFQKYADYIESKIGKYDFVFVSQHDGILSELKRRMVPFVVVAPDNSAWLSEKERKLIKQQWFGRFMLRNNDHIYDLNEWLKSLDKHYDEWTDDKSLYQHNPVTVFKLKEDQYIEDIIMDLYWKKETYPETYCHNYKKGESI